MAVTIAEARIGFNQLLAKEALESLKDLQRWLVEIIPQYLRTSFQSEPSFPATLIRGVSQKDIDLLYATVDPNAPDYKAFRYGLIVESYYGVNLPGVVTSADATEICRQLLDYDGEGVRVPLLFFLCVFAVEFQGNRKHTHTMLKPAIDDLERAKTWSRRLRAVLSELVDLETIETQGNDWHRLILTPSVVLKHNIAVELDERNLRISMRELAERIEAREEEIQRSLDQFAAIVKRRSNKQGSHYAEPVRQAFLAILELIAAARPGKRKPRAEVRDLLDLFGLPVGKQASDQWVKRAKME